MLAFCSRSSPQLPLRPGRLLLNAGSDIRPTPRAAKMAVVDIDHPDTEDYINWKVTEEHVGGRCGLRHEMQHTGQTFSVR